MSTSAIMIGRAAMLAQSLNLSVIGDNIANSNTIGYKRRSMSFSDQLGRYVGNSGVDGTRNLIGRGVQMAGTPADWTIGVFSETGQPSHIALNGGGFVPVDLNGEITYTRSGNFSLIETAVGSGQYQLMRPDGSVLMGGTLNGTNVQLGGPVTFTGLPSDYLIQPDGSVVATGATVTNGQIGVQRFANPDALTNLGGGLYRATPLASMAGNDAVQPGSSGTGMIVQGALEQSNVDLVTEFSELILAQRSYQANSRTITTANEMLQELLNIKR